MSTTRFAAVVWLAAIGTGATHAGQELSVTYELNLVNLVSRTDRNIGDEFGWSVAQDGDTIAIGDPGDNADAGADHGAVYIFRHEAPDWVLEAKLRPADVMPGDGFGTELELAGDTLIASSPGASGSHEFEGRVYVFHRKNGLWCEEQVLVSPFPHFGKRFGASMSLSADALAIGSGNPDPSMSGDVQIYSNKGATWVEQARLLAPDSSGRGSFGRAVNLEGQRLFVGANAARGVGARTGVVYVFERSGQSWTTTASIFAPDGESGDEFGSALAASGDSLIVGAPLTEASPPNNDRGTAYVFAFDGAQWIQQARLKGTVPYEGHGFGISVDIEGDQAWVISEWGYAEVYQFLRVGAAWSPGASFAYLSRDVSVRDGRLVLGRPLASGPGIATIHEELDGWAESARLEAPEGDLAAEGRFGASVAVLGNTIIVGAPASFDSVTRAFAFDRVGRSWLADATFPVITEYFSQMALSLEADSLFVGNVVLSRASGNWVREQVLEPPVGEDVGGFAASLSRSGSLGAAGAPDTGASTGAAVVISKIPDLGWQSTQVIYPPDPRQYDDFGGSVAVSENMIIVGERYHSDDETALAYQYELVDGAWTLTAEIAAPPGIDGTFLTRVVRQSDLLVIMCFNNVISISTRHGPVLVYERQANSWSLLAQLETPTPEESGWFGSSIALDGDIIAVGDQGFEDAPYERQGAVHLYFRSDTGWQFERTILSPDPESQEYFGDAVAISGDTLIVGAPGLWSHESAMGAAYVYNLRRACSLVEPCASADVFPPIGDCRVGLADLGVVLTNWTGDATGCGKSRAEGDVYPISTGDGCVNLNDLGAVLAAFGADCR